jgi:hypothetical protein
MSPRFSLPFSGKSSAFICAPHEVTQDRKAFLTLVNIPRTKSLENILVLFALSPVLRDTIEALRTGQLQRLGWLVIFSRAGNF